MTAPKRISSADITRMLSAMRRGPKTVAQMAEMTGLSHESVRRWLRVLNAEGEVHIGSYTKDERGRLFTPQWVLGAGDNAPRPGKQVTAAQRMARMRARRKAQDAKQKKVVKANADTSVGIDDLI